MIRNLKTSRTFKAVTNTLAWEPRLQRRTLPTVCAGIAHTEEPASKTRIKPPKSGPIPIANTILRWGTNAHVVRILIDPGFSIPILDQHWAKVKGVPTIQRQEPKPIEDFTGGIVPGRGKYFICSLELQHNNHCIMEAFEMGPLPISFDAILPFWWTIIHPPEDMFTKDLKTCPSHRMPAANNAPRGTFR